MRAAAANREPPVQHIAFGELLRRVQQKLPAGVIWLADEKDLAVLKLVAEAIACRHLIERRFTPQAAGNRLIFEPVVGHEVERVVGGFDVFSVNEARPEGPHPGKSLAGPFDGREALDQRAGVLHPILRRAERKDHRF